MFPHNNTAPKGTEVIQPTHSVKLDSFENYDPYVKENALAGLIATNRAPYDMRFITDRIWVFRGPEPLRVAIAIAGLAMFAARQQADFREIGMYYTNGTFYYQSTPEPETFAMMVPFSPVHSSYLDPEAVTTRLIQATNDHIQAIALLGNGEIPLLPTAYEPNL